MKEILELIMNNNFVETRNQLLTKNPVDIAHFLEEIPPEKALMVFRILPKDLGGAAKIYHRQY